MCEQWRICLSLSNIDPRWFKLSSETFPLNVKTASPCRTLLIHYSTQWRSNIQEKQNNNNRLNTEIVLGCVNGDVVWVNTSEASSVMSTTVLKPNPALVWKCHFRCWWDDELRNISWDFTTEKHHVQRYFLKHNWPTLAGLLYARLKTRSDLVPLMDSVTLAICFCAS